MTLKKADTASVETMKKADAKGGKTPTSKPTQRKPAATAAKGGKKATTAVKGANIAAKKEVDVHEAKTKKSTSIITKSTTKAATSDNKAEGAGRKRKAADAAADADEQVVGTNNTKRLKSGEDATAKSTKPVHVPATKKPQAAKPKVVINHAPTKRLDIYVSGEGSQGELGLGSGKGSMNALKPRLNPNLSATEVGVVQIAAGGMHCAALTHDNKVLTWGVNDEGALGRDTQWDGGMVDIDDNKSDASSEDIELNPKESTPGAVDFPDDAEDTVFTQVTAGDSCTFALTSEGLVYGWGTFRSNDGILGFSPFEMIQRRPVLLSGLKKVTKLAAGANHVLALCSNGAVFAWGAGQQHQLGRRIVQRTKLNGLVPREFGLPKAMTDIAAGDTHSFAIHKSGRVYTWGLNNYGQTGIAAGAGGDEAVVLHPTIVQSLGQQGSKLVCIDGGQFHSIAVTEDGKCLSWGRLDGFQTGIQIDSLPEADVIRDERGRRKILTRPSRVGDFQALCGAAGTDYSIAITRDGKAYSWGFSDGYRNGQGTDDDIEVARIMNGKAIAEKKLVWAGAGGQFSLLAGEARPVTNGLVNGGP